MKFKRILKNDDAEAMKKWLVSNSSPFPLHDRRDMTNMYYGYPYSNTPVVEALEYGAINVFRLLESEGACIQYIDVLRAGANNGCEILSWILERTVFSDTELTFVFQLSVLVGMFDEAKLLLKHGARVNDSSKLRDGNLLLPEVIIGTCVCLNGIGTTILQKVIITSMNKGLPVDLETVNFLLDHGADPLQEGFRGMTTMEVYETCINGGNQLAKFYFDKSISQKQADLRRQHELYSENGVREALRKAEAWGRKYPLLRLMELHKKYANNMVPGEREEGWYSCPIGADVETLNLSVIPRIVSSCNGDTLSRIVMDFL